MLELVRNQRLFPALNPFGETNDAIGRFIFRNILFFNGIKTSFLDHSLTQMSFI